MFSWLYDIKLDPRGVRFVLFCIWTVYLLPWEHIKCVNEIGVLSPGSFAAYNFKNRLFARSFLVETHRGWFTRKVLVTPKDPLEFIQELRSHGLMVTEG